MEAEATVLGVAYRFDGALTRRRFAIDLSSRFLFTYRSHFEPLGKKRLRSDKGWGCTLRAMQMLLAEGFSRAALGRQWRLWPSVPPPPAYGDILERFQDAQVAPFSVHSLALSGTIASKIPLGKWLGPHTAARAAVFAARAAGHNVCGLEHTHDIHRADSFPTDGDDDDFEMVRADEPEEESTPDVSVDTASHGPLLPIYISTDQLVDLGKVRFLSREWATAVVVLVPTRIGADQVPEALFGEIRRVLSVPCTLGIVGGVKRGARYFVGYTGDDCLLAFDPHRTQRALSRSAEDISYEASAHERPTRVQQIPFRRIDPNMCLGFLCKGDEDLLDCASVAAGADSPPGALFSACGLESLPQRST